jgi:hypothetical protein
MKKLLLFLFGILSLHIIYCASAEDADNQPALHADNQPALHARHTHPLHARHTHHDIDAEQFDYRSWQRNAHVSVSDDPIDRRSTCEILCALLCPWCCQSENDIEEKVVIIEIERTED